MNKKLIISKTLLFVVIVAYIIIFKSIFGGENTLIGVTTVTAMLMFLERDLTLSPFKNTVKLILINLFIGGATFFAHYNFYFGIIINFVAMFLISYSLCYNLKKPMYVPFSLEYLFLLSTPVPSGKLGMRLLALVVGALSIIILNLIFNRDKLGKTGNKYLAEATLSIVEKINLKKTNKSTVGISEVIRNYISAFRKIIYDNRIDKFYLTEEGKIKLNISVALEKINILTGRIKYSEDKDYVLGYIEESLKDIQSILINKKEFEEKSYTINEKIYKKVDERDIILLEILGNIQFIYDSLKELKALGKKHYKVVEKIEEVPDTFKSIGVIKNNFKNRSLRFSYAMRVSVGVTIGAFIMEYFKLAEGRWIMFTILSLVNPIYEVSKEKTKDRIFATIIGAIIVAILFTIFKDVTIRTLILMLAGYVGSYITAYRYNMICVTVSAIGAAAILSNVAVFSINRILFVILGAIISVILNHYVFKYDMETDNNNLIDMYKNIVKEMLIILSESYLENKNDGNKIRNLLMTTTLMDERFNINNTAVDDKKKLRFLGEQRLLICNIYELFIRIQEKNAKYKEVENLLIGVKKSCKNNYKGLNSIIEKTEEYINEIEDIREKITIANITEILTGVRAINNI